MICKLKNKKEEIRLKTKICENFEDEENGEYETKFVCPSSDLCPPNDIKEALIKDYLNNICIEYSLVAMEVEKYIDPDDYRKYLKLLNKIEYHKYRFQEEKKVFFSEHNNKNNIDFNKIDRDFKTLYCEKCCCC